MDTTEFIGKLLARITGMEMPVVFANKPKNKFMPTGQTRSSVEPVLKTMAPISNKLVEISPEFAIEFLPTLENLAAFNDDFSYAVDNIITLANTEHEIFFSDKVPDKLQKEMKLFLKDEEKKWYEFSSGSRSLKADILAQLVINGALSAEFVIGERFDRIEKVVRIAPKYIRFGYDPIKDQYEVFQTASGASISSLGKVKLNKNTYRYVALRRFFDSPYAVPPMITAIESLVIKKPMVANFKNIMEKLGMLGLLTVNVVAPEQRSGEDDADYWTRCQEYLDKYVYPQIKANISSGVVVGYKDSHEWTLEGNTMNVTGAEGLVKIVQEMIFSGLKQDPNMLGRNYSTTETFGNVILQKMTSQVNDYQTASDEFYSHLYYMALLIKGYDPGYVQVKSKPAMMGDRLKMAQAEKEEIANVMAKRDNGIISQTVAANELGYDQADDPEFKAPSKDQQPAINPQAPKEKKPAKAKNRQIFEVEKILQKHVVEFDYTTANCGTADNFASADFHDSKTNKQVDGYASEVETIFNDAVKKSSSRAAAKLSNMKADSTLEEVQGAVYLAVISKWEGDFISPVSQSVRGKIESIYTYHRKDKKVFGSDAVKQSNSFAKDKTYPEAILSLKDYRTIDFMEEHDMLYLGKFITDDSTKKRIYNYIEEKYIQEGLPIGNSGKALDEFQKEFAKVLKIDRYKIRRIIDTSVIKLKTFGNLRYLAQAEIEKYEIIELEDQLTCDYCKTMNGYTFIVSEGVDKIDAEIDAGADNISTVSPFATTIKLAEFKLMSKETLVKKGIMKPPFHCHCRGRIVAAA
ncbi:MAG: hypothetical protein EKK63_01780 [Acinetobacter sp.]|uniref:hypothetical protein n=1 Tax=Acinetobacter sp. TaxID=472 RepID=UPI000FA7B72E|nr:hypothetical protein [Acinetobacter sp.]RUP42335.1 MAG: hypothetical protein EKK63_01780 [Acinetobacter sp.]